MRAVQVGSPPSWEEAPAEFQSDLAALDRLDDVMSRKAYAAELVRSRYSSGSSTETIARVNCSFERYL